MKAYTGFAEVYDKFMDNVPYDEWVEYLTSLLKEYEVDKGIILELGCGTGSITRRLAAKGYDMIGIDISEDMLDIARMTEMERQWEESEELVNILSEDQFHMGSDENALEDIVVDGSSIPPILYLNQDMREFELYGTVAAVVSLCDSMNYITSEEELKQVFKLVNNYLDPRGVFIFDLNTVHKYKNILGDTTIAENREDCSFIWENYYHEEEMMNQYDITIFKKADLELEDELDVDTNLYERLNETHYQKAYELETVIRLLEEAGMEYVTSYEAFTKKEPQKNSERIYIIAREKKQENKLYV